jgi:GNAT superfamily N-acetyltransferase
MVRDVRPDAVRLEMADLDSPVARLMEHRLFDDLRARYPDDGLDFTPGVAKSYRPPDGAFVVAWIGLEPVGAGALRRVTGRIGELKRLWVDPRFRRRGVARALTLFREELARELGWQQLVLETGHNQPEQLANAAANGYTAVDPWSTEFPFDPRVSYLGKTL